jgi:hypothetical protein
MISWWPVMAYPLPPDEHRALDHIDAGPVVLNHVKIGCREIFNRMSQVAGHGQRL